MSAPGVARAATYYLNTTSGSDSNPGTASAPWKSLAKVESSAAAGDTIVLQSADVSTYAASWPTQVTYRANVLKQFEITWTFDTYYTVGQFANRDLWVVGPVKMIGFNPASTSVSGRIINGSTINPHPVSSQGYDSAMPNNTYSAALNVAYGCSASSPLTVQPGSSLISTISLPTVGGKTTLQRAAILTVLAAPAGAGDFRPPYCGADKTLKFNVSMLNRSLLQSLAPVASTPSLAEVEGYFAAPWIDHGGYWYGDQMHPSLNMPDYGREMHTQIGIGGLMLHLNFTLAQKETLLRRYVQLGIDLGGIALNGGRFNWTNDGGCGGARKWPILFAALMLNDATLKSVGAKSGDHLYENGYGPGHEPPDYIHFGEDDQTFYVAQLDVDATHSPNWHPDSRDGTYIPYETSDIGLAEWAIRHSTNPYLSNKYLWTYYRNVAGPPFHGTALAALLTPGGKALWNHNAYFDYSDRYMTITAPGAVYAGWWRSMSAFTANMWDTYRAQCGPIWPAAGGSAPVLAPIGNQQITTGQTLTFALSATGGTGTLTYSATGLPAGATFSNRTFTWTPGAAQAGTYSVTFTVSDGQAQDSETITITVVRANSAPVLAAIGNRSVSENQLLTLTLSATDADGDPITYTAAGLPSGATLTSRTFSWTPTYSQAGSYTVTFTASDGQLQDAETITITVANVDRPPVLAQIASQSVEVAKPLSFTLSATDPDGDTLTYSASPLPSGATLTGPAFAWTPTLAQAGSYSITFTAGDGTLASSRTATILVTAPNVAPVLDAIGNRSVNESQTLTFTISATDADSSALVYTASGLPAGATLSNRTFSWAPTYSQAGSYSVTFTVSDGSLQDAETITITVVNVNRPPVLAPIAGQSVEVTKPLSFTLSATDPDGDRLTYSAAPLPGGATLTGSTFAWTPASTQAGTYTVTFTVSDGTLTNSQAATLVVTKPDAAPVLATIGDRSVNEGQLLTFTLGATDADGNPITYTATGLPAGATLSGQTFRWTPTYSQAGSYTVTFTAGDGQVQDSETITITVVNVNQPPVLAQIASQSVTATKLLSFTLSATDPDGDRLSYAADALPEGATLTGSAFAWTPASTQAGTYTVTFTVSDGTLSDSQPATLTVTSEVKDQLAPVVTGCAPAPDAIQVALDNVAMLRITDDDSGVDANTVTIRVNDAVVYEGNTDVYTSALGRCSRTGVENDYGFLCQANALFDFDRPITVRVNAADRAGNRMNEYVYTFTTQMRAFGTNQTVSTPDGYADRRPATACDAIGNVWVVWEAGEAGSRDIYAAQRPAGATLFQAPLQVTSDKADQCHPCLAVTAAGAVYVVWQDNRSGNWDLYAATCTDGRIFSKDIQATNSTHNEINPVVALDRRSPAGIYVAWQDDRDGHQDIYVAYSTNTWASATVTRVTSDAADQVEPAVVVDSGDVAYVFWTDLRSGQADLYAAASVSTGAAGAWANVPVVTGPGAQTRPAIAAGAEGTVHLLWVDNRNGNNDIYYALLPGLPASPVSGVNVVDDTSGADQTAPTVVCGPDQAVFAGWADARHAAANATDTDLYVAEVRAGQARTNVWVGDDGTGSNQGEPALGVDQHGQPYLVWTDDRRPTPEIYCAAATRIDPTPLDAQLVVASAGAVLGTDPASISSEQDVSLVVPAGACPTDLRITISHVVNPQVTETALLNSYDFGPSGVEFAEPVTITIPYAVLPRDRKVLPFWYNAVTGALSQQGITDVQNLNLNPRLDALQFRTTHFTPYYLVEAAADGQPLTGSGGGCALSARGHGSLVQFLVPYAAIAVFYLLLRRRDRRKRDLPADR